MKVARIEPPVCDAGRPPWISLEAVAADGLVGWADAAFVRINARPKAELVENVDELRAQLAGTRFDWVLVGAA